MTIPELKEEIVKTSLSIYDNVSIKEQDLTLLLDTLIVKSKTEALEELIESRK